MTDTHHHSDSPAPEKPKCSSGLEMDSYDTLTPAAAPTAYLKPKVIAPVHRIRHLTVDDYVRGVEAGDRTILARTITLVESRSPRHEAMAQEVIHRILPRTGRAKRIGITGVPGVGKSTFLEAFGCMLTKQSHKVAVLAIDPSSSRSGGSILGDKTRMENLSRDLNAFIRPSPSGESLGGVARRTRETMLLCEAAGYDTVLVESVGVGQSEVTLRSMTDFYLVLMLPGAGDELQGIKKGILEMADMIFINKADGSNRLKAEDAKMQYTAAIHYSQPVTPEWQPEVFLGSGLTGEGLPHIWEQIERFYKELEPRGIIAQRRQEQALDWLSDLIRDELVQQFYRDPRIVERIGALRQSVLDGQITAVRAASVLLALHAGKV